MAIGSFRMAQLPNTHQNTQPFYGKTGNNNLETGPNQSFFL